MKEVQVIKRTLLQAILEEHHASIFYSQINTPFFIFINFNIVINIL